MSILELSNEKERAEVAIALLDNIQNYTASLGCCGGNTLAVNGIQHECNSIRAMATPGKCYDEEGILDTTPNIFLAFASNAQMANQVWSAPYGQRLLTGSENHFSIHFVVMTLCFMKT